MSATEPTWQAIATRKKDEQSSRIPAEWRLSSAVDLKRTNLLSVPFECGIMTATEIEITETVDAYALLQHLLNRKWTSEDVVKAFCKRAAIAHQATNCLTEIFFDDALERARDLDNYMKQHGKPKGPLHGLPISLKDTFKVAGYDASIGIAALCFKPSATNSTIVDMLLDAGAVIYCKTNVPQTMMALDSHNNIFGRTINPSNTALTAGGSSGGEATLVAMRGSILGIGTDVGGSIRIPAMCHGLYGIKPSHGRLSYADLEGGAIPGSEAVTMKASAGPITHSVRDCELLMRVLGDMEGWRKDPEVIPQSWSGMERLGHTSEGKPNSVPLRVGIVRTDGVTTPLPPIARFMDEVANQLRKSKPSIEIPEIEVVDLDISSLFGKCQALANKIFSIEGANNWFDLLEQTGEPLSPWLQSRLKRRPRYSLDQVKDVHANRSQMQTEFLHVWNTGEGSKGAELDAIICPVAPHPVPEIDRYNTASYTSTWVLMDYPAATIPIRSMQHADLEGELSAKSSGSFWDKYNRTLWSEVDRKVYLDSSLCIQVVTKRLQERKLVEVMHVLDKVLHGGGGEKARL